MTQTTITYFGKQLIAVCDNNCKKAWGNNSRPKIQLNELDDNDYEFLADSELDEAPVDPGTYEGEDAKPVDQSEIHNKWCVRECERCSLFSKGQKLIPEDFSVRVPNYQSRRK